MCSKACHVVVIKKYLAALERLIIQHAGLKIRLKYLLLSSYFLQPWTFGRVTAVMYILQMQSRSGARAVGRFARHCMTRPIVL